MQFDELHGVHPRGGALAAAGMLPVVTQEQADALQLGAAAP